MALIWISKTKIGKIAGKQNWKTIKETFPLNINILDNNFREEKDLIYMSDNCLSCILNYSPLNFEIILDKVEESVNVISQRI